LIAHTPVGRPALIVICAGLLAYALWKFTQGIFGHGPEGGGSMRWKDRIANLAGGVVYLGFFAVAIRTLSGSVGNSSGEPSQAASGVLGWPGGRLIVGIAGAGLIAISLYQLYDAVRGGFADESNTEHMGSRQRRLFMLLGRVGLGARALVFALIGSTSCCARRDRLQGQQRDRRRWCAGSTALPTPRTVARRGGRGGATHLAVYSLIEARYRRL
jgi:Domain of Unknown Function (DUF1206)